MAYFESRCKINSLKPKMEIYFLEYEVARTKLISYTSSNFNHLKQLQLIQLVYSNCKGATCWYRQLTFTNFWQTPNLSM